MNWSYLIFELKKSMKYYLKLLQPQNIEKG